jgi:hypothetical protein
MKRLKNNKGQGIISEYSLFFFVVTAFVIAMTVYVKRTVQARIHGAERYVMQQVNTAMLNPANNLVGGISGQYEPYYYASEGIRTTESTIIDRELAAGKMGIFEKDIVNATSGFVGTTTQFSPQKAP